jgi:glycosyltransferase involved in cell wall biosynthesis
MNYRIGLEVSSLLTRRKSGIQRYIFEITRSLALLVSTDQDFNLELCYKASRIKKRRLRPNMPINYRWYWPLPFFSTQRYDIVHAMDTTLPWHQPKLLLCTLHDIFSIVIQGYSNDKFREKKLQNYQRIVQHSHGVIVPSYTTKRDFLDKMSYPEEKVFVVPHGVNEYFFSLEQIDQSVEENFGCPLEEPYVLTFGGAERKNTARVVQAYATSKIKESHKLLVIGKMEHDVLSFIKKHQIYHNIVNMHGISDSQMFICYKNASVLCFPSLYEGFGLPILEGMASGIPVVTSNNGAPAELAKGYGILVDPESIEDIRYGLNQAISIDQDKLKLAQDYAHKFTWKNSAQKLLDIYNSFLC